MVSGYLNSRAGRRAIEKASAVGHTNALFP
jgi:hypothetical protein